MKFLNTRIKKITFWTFSIIIAFAILVVVFISPIAKYLIEKYDYKFTGREIELDWVYLNPFTGYVHLDDVKIYESKSDSVFISASGITTNLAMHKLLSKTYELSSITLKNPIIHVYQNKKKFNFSDIIEKFTPKKDSIPKPKKEPVHFNFLKTEIVNGTFYYHETNIPVNYFIKKVNISTEGKKWNQDTMDIKVALTSGIGSGTIDGSFFMNFDNLDFKIKALINKFDLSAFEQYLKGMANYGSIRANLDADIEAVGNFKKSEQLNAKGLVAINDFHFGKSKTEDYASFLKTVVSIKQLSPVNKIYAFDSIAITKPYFKYERYDHLDNLQYMFGKRGEKVKEAKDASEQTNILFQIGNYIKLLAKNFFKSNYEIKRLAVYDADIHYEDYALNEKFMVAATPLTIIADSINRSSNKWVDLSLKTQIKPYGEIKLNLSINPQDSSDFSLSYHLDKLPVAMFNPYLITYTSFPLDRGTVEIKGDWKVNDGVINSRNHLMVIDPRINKKQKRNGATWIPMKLIMFFVRERGNVIDYEIPINGNLNNPKFKLKDVILDVVTNIFVKPVTSLYRYEVKTIETEIEKSMIVRWDLNSSVLPNNQQKFMDRISEYLKDNPKVSITANSIWFKEKEKEYILFFEAKKMYYLSTHSMSSKKLSESDSLAIEKIPIKDSSFIHYLNKNIKNENIHTVQQKCTELVGQKLVDSKYEKLISDRQKVFLSYFKNAGVEKQIKLMGDLNKIPYNGFSIYKINYKGNIPDDLQEDYERINELNDESPRKKFKKLREKYRKELRNK